MRPASQLALAAVAAGVSASSDYLGFNSGSTKVDGSAKQKSDFVAEMQTAQKLVGAPGTFNSLRLYTNIQGGTTSDPISAFEAAVDTKTNLLLGIWASGTTSIDNELTALKAAASQYGKDWADLVIGISIGSEDLYRNSVTGVTNKAGVGADPDVITGFISQYKKAVSGTVLENVPVGHVDTWDAWTNSSNKAVIDAVDFLGLDEYPYYENGKGNTIENAPALFQRAFDAANGVAGGKPLWVTETGWPYTGETWDQAVCSLNNAQYYWDHVGCAKLFNKVPTFWYTLEENNSANKQTFSISDNLSTTPLFNLTCPANIQDSSSSAAGSSSAAATATSGSGSAASGSAAAQVTGDSTTGSSSGSTESGAASSSSSPAKVASGAAKTQMVGLGVMAAVAGFFYLL